MPAAGFTQEPATSKNLNLILYPPGGRAHIPTTLDYAIRITQKDNPHFAFDIGVGQVAGRSGPRHSDANWAGAYAGEPAGTDGIRDGAELRY